MAENKQIVQRRVSMAQDKNNLIWLDMEMTGLNPDSDRIIELAVVITDSQLNIVAESPVYVLHQAEAVMEGMDKWNKSTHGRSGLIERVSASILNEADVERQMLEYLQQFSPARSSPMWPSRTNSRARTHWGCVRTMKASPIFTPVRICAASSSRASAASRPSGFSQSTCLPASAQRMDHGTCR